MAKVGINCGKQDWSKGCTVPTNFSLKPTDCFGFKGTVMSAILFVLFYYLKISSVLSKLLHSMEVWGISMCYLFLLSNPSNKFPEYQISITHHTSAYLQFYCFCSVMWQTWCKNPLRFSVQVSTVFIDFFWYLVLFLVCLQISFTGHNISKCLIFFVIVFLSLLLIHTWKNEMHYYFR